MYKTLVLIKEPIKEPELIEEKIKEICLKIGIIYDNSAKGSYGSKKEDFVPIYSFFVRSDDYNFQINYQEGLGSFQNDNNKGFVRTDYNGKFEIYSREADIDMDYFNDFVLLCENIESIYDGVSIGFNRENKFWEVI